MLRPARPGLRHNSAFPVQLPPSVYTGLRRWSALPPALLPGALIVLAVRMLFHPGWNWLGHIHSLSDACLHSGQRRLGYFLQNQGPAEQRIKKRLHTDALLFRP